MLSTTKLLTLCAATASATNLFVSDYSGAVTSLELTASNGSYALNETSQSPECGPSPSWLTIDANRGLLFCMNEGLTAPNGSLSSFTINGDGSLTHVKNETTITGPVSGVIYGAAAGQRAIALAHYSGAAVSSYLLNGGGKFDLNQELTFSLSEPGAVPDRQDAPHEHEAILDPTSQYVVVPDLGADLVRIFSYDKTTLKLKKLSPLEVTPGTGPRHAVFWNPSGVACESCPTYFYLVGELDSTVTGFAVEYLPNGGGLNFTQVSNSTTYGLLNVPEGNAPAEIQVSPDNQYIIVSNRNDTSFNLPQPDGSVLASDSLTTFKLQDDGSLVWHQLWPSGGSFPRQFSIDKTGTLVAVGNQNSQNVVILQRDVATGLIGEPVARMTLGGNTTCVVWGQ